MSPLLGIDRLRLSYATGRGIVTAVEEATLTVQEGEAVGLVGESGSGKSSLARAVLGLLPRGVGRIERGSITVRGRDITRLSPREWERFRGNPVAMVFQDPLSSLNPVMRVGTQIAESVTRHERTAAPAARVAELLRLVHLPPACARAYPHELSGGMRQRALLAVALGCRPALLIADEPTTALDVTTQAEILSLLRELRTELGMALLLISHDLGVVSAACDRVAIMYAGRTVEWGATPDVFGQPAHPYAASLLQAGRALRDAAGRFVTIEGELVAGLADRPGCPFAPRCPAALPRCEREMPPRLAAGPGHDACCWLLPEAAA
ncbi:MAG: ABC transporter ATP-binding protein [Acetobacteraceae bacterium]